MNPKPSPKIPGNTTWDRLDSALRKVFSVPKERVLKEESKQKRKRQRKRARKQEKQST